MQSSNYRPLRQEHTVHFGYPVQLLYIPNLNVNYVRFPIKYEGKVYNAQYIQIILYPDPIILGIIDESNHVYSQPLHAMLHYDLT